MTLQNITEFYTEWVSVCFNVTSKFCTIAIFKSFIKQIICSLFNETFSVTQNI
jgi:hypothetical protein